MKTPKDVGADFDEYAARWRKESYGLEAGYDGAGVTVDETRAAQVQRPGDEWGDVAPLREAYAALIARLAAPKGLLNVLEIGAGGGRSTATMLDVLGERCGEYHVVDVSAGFVEVLQDRIDRPIHVHIVDDVNLDALPAQHFEVCLAQSSWSHIGLYDQYRYLRELRRVLRPGAVLYVNGQFLLGLGNDWTWNRFRRRVYQIDHSISGVFHEFTSVAALAEMLTRLGYTIECINTAGFVARRGPEAPDRGVVPLAGAIEFPFNSSPHDFLRTGRTVTATLPTVVTTTAPAQAPGRSLRRQGTTAWSAARRSAKRIPGLRSLVVKLRRSANTVASPEHRGGLTSAPRRPAAPAKASPATVAANDDVVVWDRASSFGPKFTPHRLDEYIGPVEDVAWATNNPFLGLPTEELLTGLLSTVRWRHHHGIAELKARGSIYHAYAGRVDAMLEMLDVALQMAAVEPTACSFVDLGAAEGYVVNHLLGRGAVDVDAVELAAGNIERMWKVRAYRGIDAGRIGRVDLQRAGWSRDLGRTYDVTLALGVIYHMENPLLFARNLYEVTNRVAVVESDTPLFPGNERFRGFGNLYLHRDQVTVSPGDVRYITEMRPDRQALAEILLEAGFDRVRLVPPRGGESSRYFVTGEKSMFVAERSPASERPTAQASV